jgi:NADH-quinone oxidoreductase subunit N
LVVGFGFKVAAAPFHMWTPDVYEGAPTSVTAFMAVAVKAAAFAAFARVFFLAFPAIKVDWNMLIWVLAVATMTIGNVAAIAQTNIKRMLAYSSIAHAGYLLVALVAANQLGAMSLLYYLLAYTLMNLGAFGVVILVGRKKDSYLNIYDYSGLGAQHPVLAASMALFMFALAAFPPLRVCRQVLYLFRGRAGGLYLAGHHRRDEFRDIRVLLSAHHRAHVHETRGSGPGNRELRTRGDRHPADHRRGRAAHRHFPRIYL